jgi:SOUL heme-binding protein
MPEPLHIPFVEILKSIPGFFGIRLEEEPRHEVIEKIGEIEVRRYAPALLAEVTVQGAHEEALDAAFDRLARYIFGGNSRREDMHMTNPVYQSKGQGQGQGQSKVKVKGERMPMTTPVIQSSDGDGWTVSFFLSNNLTAEEAPRPDDSSIKLTQSAERLIASLRYRGNNTEEKMHDARGELLEALRNHPKYKVDGSVFWAQYDAPFVLPFVKRNEAQVELSMRVWG